MSEKYAFDPKLDGLRRPPDIVLTPIRSIRKACIECTGGERGEVERCTVPGCWFYPYRLGNRITGADLDAETRARLDVNTSAPAKIKLKSWPKGREFTRPAGCFVTPLEAIKYHCLYCMGSGLDRETYDRIRSCSAPKCWLWPYRTGKRTSGEPQE